MHDTLAINQALTTPLSFKIPHFVSQCKRLQLESNYELHTGVVENYMEGCRVPTSSNVSQVTQRLLPPPSTPPALSHN